MKRSLDKTLKTQFRWGHKDVQVFVKTRGENEKFRKIPLKEFMDGDELPDYDSALRWNQRRDQRLKNRPVFGQDCPVLPSLAASIAESRRPKTLSRKLSSGSRGEMAKKSRSDTLNRSDALSSSSNHDTDQDMDHDQDQEEDPLQQDDEDL